MPEPLPLFNSPISRKRIESYFERKETKLEKSDIGYNYSVLCQCFLPYRDPNVSHWERRNGLYSLVISSGVIHDPKDPTSLLELGIPFGPKPRLFMCYLNSLAIKRQSPVVPVAPNLSAMLRELNLSRTGEPRGSITSFKKQIMRLAASNFLIIGPGPRGGEYYTKAPPIKEFNVRLPQQTDQRFNVWPSEVVLTSEYFESLRDHAVPYDVNALQSLQNNARALDIFLWATQRLPRLTSSLLMRWPDLFELFGGGLNKRHSRLFKQTFRDDCFAARLAYGDKAVMEETPEGFKFYPSPPPVPRALVPSRGLTAAK